MYQKHQLITTEILKKNFITVNTLFQIKEIIIKFVMKSLKRKQKYFGYQACYKTRQPVFRV